jgi:hypothetical protein
MAAARHGMCELTRHSMAGERHGRGMARHGRGVGAAWHGVCEIALYVENAIMPTENVGQ